MDKRTDTEKAMDWFLNGVHDWSKERKFFTTAPGTEGWLYREFCKAGDRATSMAPLVGSYLFMFHPMEKDKKLDYLRAQMIAYEFHQQDQRRKMMNKITMEGKYQTRDGRVVRLLATDFKAGAICVIGTITLTDDNEIVGLWSADGRVFPWGSPNNPDDLIPVPEREPVVHQMWAVMKSNDEITYSSYSKMEAEIHCNLFAGETVRLIQWNT